MFRSLLLLLSLVCLGGCASTRCLGDQPYAHAESIEPIKPVEGLKMPEATAALKIPPPPANPVPFGEKVKDAEGEEVVQCLDKPPPMPPPAPEKPAS
jgi:hypothetical protein